MSHFPEHPDWEAVIRINPGDIEDIRIKQDALTASEVMIISIHLPDILNRWFRFVKGFPFGIDYKGFSRGY